MHEPVVRVRPHVNKKPYSLDYMRINNPISVLFTGNLLFLFFPSQWAKWPCFCLFHWSWSYWTHCISKWRGEFVNQVIAKSQMQCILLYCISRPFNHLQTPRLKAKLAILFHVLFYSSLHDSAIWKQRNTKLSYILQS